VRAELARRRISGREIAGVLNWSERTARRRLGGSTPFTAEELASVARHLNMPIADLLPPASP
jgi:transcriptional regulator with XRE-family HTH domain